MKMTKAHNSLISVFLLAVIAGCASPIDKSLRDEVVPGITFPMVFANPDAYQGDMVVWGGSIIRTERTKTGSYVYVLQTDLGLRDKPEDMVTSAGRFIAVTDHQLDPLVYAKGRKFTVAGTVTGKKIVNNKKTGTGYTYPLVKADQIYIWKKPKPVSPDYWDSYYYDDGSRGDWGGDEDHGGMGDGGGDEDKGGGDRDKD